VSIPNVGKVFATAEPFLDYLDSLQFNAWRPRFITMHHTGAPSLRTWRGWQTRKVPVTDDQWLKNLAHYYGSSKAQGGPGDGPWRAGPHFMFTPTHFCVLSPPTARGVHAVSFNSVAWGVECVGDFDTETMTPELKEHYATGIACLYVALGIQPAPFERGVRGLHFHRDDPKTTKTCPGRTVQKPDMVAAAERKIAAMTDGDGSAEQVQPVATQARYGVVVNAADGLNVRADASAKAPAVGSLTNGTRVAITGEAKNGDTKWFRTIDGYVAARFVKLA
jgi:hypothetical protein